MDAGPAPARRLDGLQVLRAISVLLVIWTHLKFAGDFSGNPWIQNSIGAAGVDVFFVISGFVICLSAKSLNFRGDIFFVNRVVRVVPIYWLTAAPLILASYLKGKHNWNSITSTFTFLPIFDFVRYTEPTNGSAWTLAYEFWFYSMTACALVLAKKSAWKELAVFCVLGFILAHWIYPVDYILPRFLFSPLLAEFFFGVILCTYAAKLGRRALIVSLTGALVFTVLLCTKPDLGDWMLTWAGGMRRVFFMGGFGVCMVCAFVAAERLGFNRWPRWALFLGDSSYCIYLVQTYSLWVAINIGSRWHWPPAWRGLMFVFASLALGILVTKTVEKPLLRICKSAIGRFALRRTVASPA